MKDINLSKHYSMKSQSTLATAKALLYNVHDYDSSVNRSYYSVFYATLSWLYISDEVFEERSYKSAIGAFNKLLYSKNIKELTTKEISRIEQKRNKADYGKADETMTLEDAVYCVEEAERVVNLINKKVSMDINPDLFNPPNS